MIRDEVLRVAMVGTHVPRRCGIATFTADLAAALQGAGARVRVIVLEEEGSGLHYGPPVDFQIRSEVKADYRRAALWARANLFDAVCLQHEFGIFGGRAGEDVLEFLRTVDLPVVTTLHTVLEQPTDEQRAVFDEVVELSELVVTMSRRGAKILVETYGINPVKILRIPHGTPVVPPKDCASALRKMGLEGRRLLLTFGLLSPDKGIEDAIRGMPAIVDRHPSALYVIAGTTHPHIKAKTGEAYRDSLRATVDELGLEEHVRFEDSFLSQDEIACLLQAADIVITPYRKREQITSGVLSIASASGNAVVSTPYWHAEELLADGRGRLVDFRDPNGIATAVNGLLDDPASLRSMQSKAWEGGAETRWPEVAERYVRALRNAQSSVPMALHRPVLRSASHEPESRSVVSWVSRLMAMSDDVGLVQHAKYSVPLREEGYCVDDNSRALSLVNRWLALNGPDGPAERARSSYLAFVLHAYDREARRFRNFMTYGREWSGGGFSDDADGRSLAALATVVENYGTPLERHMALEILEHALKRGPEGTGLRGSAQTVIALGRPGLLKVLPAAQHWFESAVDGLSKAWRAQATADWPWFEDRLTYENARLCEALIVGGALTGKRDVLDDGLESLHWLMKVQTDERDRFEPVGSDAPFVKGGHKPRFDQQPVEAWASVDATMAAFHNTEEACWKSAAKKTYDWFRGNNIQTHNMVDSETGGVYDGLGPAGPNWNQGAESTLSLGGCELTLKCKCVPSGAVQAAVSVPGIGVA